MLPDLTPAVDRGLQAAQQLARQAGCLAVEPEHLCHGLLEEEEGRASVLLSRAGAKPAVVRRLFSEHTSGPGPHSGETPLPYSPKTREILEHAGQLARELSAEHTLGSDHLLLALLRCDEPLRRKLEGLGLVFSQLEGELVSEHKLPLPLDEPLRLAEATELIDAGRIIDAAANRAREALRVVEDYCRFVLDDSFLSGELKTLRHGLAEILVSLPSRLLLEARETLRDVGTALSTEKEQQRHSPLAVVRANLKRLQEALRTLEEFGKIFGPTLGQGLERLRYRTYTLERAIVLGTGACLRLADARLYVLVTGSECTTPLDWTIKEAAAGGADMFQLREKELGDRALLERARSVRRWTKEAEVLFIMNDRPDIARLAEADGIHLGQEDAPVKEARRILGPDAVIGVSTHNLDQVRQAVLDGADYIGVGPTFPSGTKDFDHFPGLDFVRQAAAETSLPAFVIGGVTVQNIALAAGAGARRVAVSQAICRSDHPRAAAMELRRILQAHGSP